MYRKSAVSVLAVLVMLSFALAPFVLSGCGRETPIEPMVEEAAEPQEQTGERLLLSPTSPPQSMGDFKWPFRGSMSPFGIPEGGEYWRMTCGYGCGYHTGTSYHAVDLVRVDGTTSGSMILAPAYGTVTAANWSSSLGWHVRMDHGNGWSSLVAHMNCDPRYFVDVGNVLRQGTLLGITGATGWATGPHIHFVVYRYGNSQPLTNISGWRSITTSLHYNSGNVFVSPPSGRTGCP